MKSCDQGSTTSVYITIVVKQEGILVHSARSSSSFLSIPRLIFILGAGLGGVDPFSAAKAAEDAPV